MGSRNPVDSQNRRKEEKIFLQEVRHYPDEASILLRRSDRLPLYAEGDPEDLLGVSLRQMQEDVSGLFGNLKEAGAGEKLWQKYEKWDGVSEFSEDFVLKNGE